MWLAQPLLMRKLRKRALAEPGYGVAMQERLGYYDAPAADFAGATIWLHAVSLGETRAAAVLVQGLRAAIPGMRLVLTHGTATGREAGLSLLTPGDIQVWQPWDTPGAVQRFLARFKPRIGLLMETEVWPNMAALCAIAGVPLCLVNARMSDKSLRQSLRLGWLAKPAYAALHAVWAQTESDAARLRQLGAPVQAVTGNLKFDASPDAAQVAQGNAWRAEAKKPVVMFASSREGEEAMWVDALQARAARANDTEPDALTGGVQWLIVPRHPQRFDQVAELLANAGYVVSRRSAWQDGPPQGPKHDTGRDPTSALPGDGERGDHTAATVWLGDSLGEMAVYFGMADVALLGGSFARLGGQNLIEAAACACPVIMGPHTFNFSEAAQMAASAGAAMEVNGLAQAVDVALELVHAPQKLQQARAAARQWSQAHRGAADRTVAMVQAVWADEA